MISNGKGVRSGLGCLLVAGAAAIGACSVGRLSGDDSPPLPSNLQEGIYKPDILAKPDTIYKKPGYHPL